MFQTSRRRGLQEDDISDTDSHDGSVAVVITMPSCLSPKREQLNEFALGVAQVRWYGHGLRDEGDTPRQAVT